MRAYFVPEAPVTASMEIKKSRFITLLSPTQGIIAAKAFVRQCRVDYPGATHYCWAYIAGPAADSQQLGFSDDGEPSGTAGRPMLGQLLGSGLGEITAVAVRYYGGVKLGTGGLVKAYGGGVQQALKLINRVEKKPQVEFLLTCRYEQQAWVDEMLKQSDGHIVKSDYGERITLIVALPFDRVALADERLGHLSRGTLKLTPIAN